MQRSSNSSRPANPGAINQNPQISSHHSNGLLAWYGRLEKACRAYLCIPPPYQKGSIPSENRMPSHLSDSILINEWISADPNAIG